jgi:hypothetical protein
MWAVEVTVACTRGQTLLCPNVHAACPETTCVYLGPTFLRSTPTQKNKLNNKIEVLNS